MILKSTVCTSKTQACFYSCSLSHILLTLCPSTYAASDNTKAEMNGVLLRPNSHFKISFPTLKAYTPPFLQRHLRLPYPSCWRQSTLLQPLSSKGISPLCAKTESVDMCAISIDRFFRALWQVFVPGSIITDHQVEKLRPQSFLTEHSQSMYL